MSSENEDDNLMDIETIQNKILSQPKGDRMQVSAWDDDDDGIEEIRNPKDPLQKAMLDAAENGNIEKVKQLYKLDPLLINCSDKDGYTPLHRACYGNNLEIVQYLLEFGANINAVTIDGWQPLHSACHWNNIDCASTLITHGADINAKSKGDQTPLHLACVSSQNSLCLQLLLLNSNINPFLKNSSGDTAYEIAKRNGMYYPIFEITEPCLNEI